MERIRVIDSHTGGEPTRVVIASSIKLDGSTMAERCLQFSTQYDQYRRAIVCEPRGSDIVVGALLTEPVHAESEAGVVFFNNVGTLGMCGHGLIGVAAVLRHLRRIQLGRYLIDTAVGTVAFEMLSDNQVRIENVPSFRWRSRQPLEIFKGTAEQRIVHGDIAWGGNWFFICEDHGEVIDSSNLSRLERTSLEIRRRLDELAITGRDGQVIDHVELITCAADTQRSDAKNFVLCPGSAYDRSPCGTGTSAKLACLAADGKLAPGEVHRQESVVGSQFAASFQWSSTGTGTERSILPTIVGSAYITGEAELLLDDRDPFCWGLIAL